ncbi:MAG: potassium channel family protein, partial [Geminicoccaceae bacterium]
FIMLRYMRRPIMVLIAVYAISMVGWILIPGVGVDGNPEQLSLFHAFYFLTYTVTTTGFGELPHAFTEGQRMWGIVSLYAGVIAWFYALGSIVGLVQNPDFQQSLAERSFAKRVRRIADPFVIICGFGNTGALLTRGLSDRGLTVIVVEREQERIKTLTLRDYRSEVCGLCADARVPEHLIEAGLSKPNCRALVALTQNEELNLKIAVTARLLSPDIEVVIQSTSAIYEDTLATLGDNLHIMDPFQTYAKYLGATISNPAIHNLNRWLAGTPGATLNQHIEPPCGHWVLCGYGRMGHWLRESLESQGISITMIEPDPRPEDRSMSNLLVGRANQARLQEAGIEHAAGIVAGTDNDADNLSILINAKALNPKLFLVVRQNRYRNQVVFEAAAADFIMMPSLVTARRIRFLLTAPLLKMLFETLAAEGEEGNGRFVDDIIEHLRTAVGGEQPHLWTLDIDAVMSGAVLRILNMSGAITLGHLISDPSDRQARLACVPLVLKSKSSTKVLPPPSTPVRQGDQILLCGTAHAHHLLDATINNEYTLRYLITGKDEPRSWVMTWLLRKLPRYA